MIESREGMVKLDHLSLLVADVPRSRIFYERLLSPFGYRLNRDYGEAAAGLGDANYAVLALVRCDEPIQPVHLAFRLETRDQVESFFSLAIALGARDNGAPGLRPHYHESYYAGFVFDPDGHNLEAVCHREDGSS
jgi:catechol 2,3-dioxygenase-like lactoylglutathione lyase family enzyme